MGKRAQPKRNTQRRQEARSKDQAPATAPVVDQVAETSSADPFATSYDSIAAAAAALGIPATKLKWAKRKGCPGFRGSRVYPAEVLPWLEAAAQDTDAEWVDKTELEKKLLTIRIEREEFSRDAERGKYVTKAEMGADLTRLGAEQKSILRQKLENELPGLIEGLSPEQRSALRAAGKELLADVCRRMQRLVAKWTC